MRKRGRTDNNHAEVVKALRDASMQVLSLSTVGGGCPDLLVSWRGVNVLIEVKDGGKTPGNRPLTRAQEEFHSTWAGPLYVVTSAEEAIKSVIAVARLAGFRYEGASHSSGTAVTSSGGR